MPYDSYPLLQFISQNETTIRLSFFIAMLLLIGLWEILAPKRALKVSKLLRWSNNLGLVFFNSLLLRLIFPAAAVGMAAFASLHGWGIFNYYSEHPLLAVLGPPVVAVIIFEITLNAMAMFNHGNIGLPVGLDKLLRFFVVTPDMHRVHHSVKDDETNSNFGFNLSCWDRLFGTYREQPRGGQIDMQIGIKGFNDAKQTAWIHSMLIMPFIGKINGYVINRREWNTKD
jgi:fatty acid hydroxylase family protein